MKFSPLNMWTLNANLSALLWEANSRYFFNFVKQRQGYVYAMAHPDRKGALKIGRTSKNPFERAKTLGTAGILGAFEVLWVAQVANSAWAETVLHNILEPYHVDKEFFAITLEEAKVAIDRVLSMEMQLLSKIDRDLLLKDDYTEWVEAIDVESLI